MRFEDIPHNLVQRAREGQSEAMEELCLLVQPGAYTVLLSLLRNTEDASDALQDSMIRMIRFLPGVRDAHALPGWLMRLLANQANESRRRSAAPVVDVSALEENAASARVASTASQPFSPRHVAEAHEMIGKINQAVSALSERQRTALVLFEMENLTIREVAAIMELTDGAVKFHLHEARKNMRHHLQNIGIFGSDLYEEAPSR